MTAPVEIDERADAAEVAELSKRYPPGAPDPRAVSAGDGPTITTPLDLVADHTGFTAVELMAYRFEPVRWAVAGLLAEGANLLAGPPKIGKSWFALDLAVAVATGGKAFGKIDVDAGPVAYYALEDTARRLQGRLRTVLAGAPAPEQLHFRTICAPLPEGADTIKDWLRENPDARLVIVDVLTRVRPTTSDRANRYDADYQAVAALKAIADEFSVAFLIVHHVRKAVATDFLEMVSGTHGLAGAADTVLILTRSRGSAQAVLRITGRDVEEAQHALDFRPDIGNWQLLDGLPEDYELGDTRRQILQFLRGRGGLTPSEIAKALALKIDNVKQTCRRMLDDDQILTDGSGRYCAPLVDPGVTVTLSPDSSDSLFNSDVGDRSDRDRDEYESGEWIDEDDLGAEDS